MLIETFDQNKFDKIEIMSKDERNKFINEVIKRIFTNINKKEERTYEMKSSK